jgi:hypothetical protein
MNKKRLIHNSNAFRATSSAVKHYTIVLVPSLLNMNEKNIARQYKINPYTVSSSSQPQYAFSLWQHPAHCSVLAALIVLTTDRLCIAYQLPADVVLIKKFTDYKLWCACFISWRLTKLTDGQFLEQDLAVTN